MPFARNKKLSRVGFFVALTFVLVTVVLLPFGLVSLVGSLAHPTGLTAYEIGNAQARSHDDFISVNVDGTALHELDHTIDLRVSGVQTCKEDCGIIHRLRIYSMGANPRLSQGVPPSVYIDVPGDESEIDKDVTLPLEGSLASYPFDTYHLLLGVSITEVSLTGQERIMTKAQQHDYLSLSFGEEIPRVDVSVPESVTPIGVLPPEPYGLTSEITFGRPLYLQIFTVLVLCLTALAAFYGVLMRPFEQIILNSGVIVLGMWGIRSLLVGSYPADSTAVDLILIVVVLFLLLSIATRGLYALWHITWPAHGHDPNHRHAGGMEVEMEEVDAVEGGSEAEGAEAAETADAGAPMAPSEGSVHIAHDAGMGM